MIMLRYPIPNQILRPAYYPNNFIRRKKQFFLQTEKLGCVSNDYDIIQTKIKIVY